MLFPEHSQIQLQYHLHTCVVGAGLSPWRRPRREMPPRSLSSAPPPCTMRLAPYSASSPATHHLTPHLVRGTSVFAFDAPCSLPFPLSLPVSSFDSFFRGARPRVTTCPAPHTPPPPPPSPPPHSTCARTRQRADSFPHHNTWYRQAKERWTQETESGTGNRW